MLGLMIWYLIIDFWIGVIFMGKTDYLVIRITPELKARPAASQIIWKGGAPHDLVVYPVAARSTAACPCKTPKVTLPRMAHAVRGLLLLSVYSGGFSSVCPIFHFNASVRRFNVWCYPYTAAVPLVLWPLFMALWCGVVPCAEACRLRGALPACRRPRSPVALSAAVPCSGGALSVAWGLRWPLRRAWLSAKVAGIVVPLCAKVAGKVASACAKVAHFALKS